MSQIAEIRRRNVHRAAAGYIVAAWLIIQVAETIFPLFGLGDNPARLTVIVLVALFIPAMALSWVFEVTPEGIKRDQEIDRSQPVDPATGRRFDRAIMVVLALAVAYFAVDKFVLTGSPEVATSEMAEAVIERSGPPMVAVLPFIATSLEGDGSFFADGVHEDLLTQLAQLESLRVISRSSVQHFREGERNLRDMSPNSLG